MNPSISDVLAIFYFPDGKVAYTEFILIRFRLQTKPLYKYGYSVFDPYTLDVKSQWEHRDGDVVRGAYNMLEADGSLRIVEYTSDKDTGFRAVVKKIPFYMDMSRRPVETFPKYSKPQNQYQEVQPEVYNEPPRNYVNHVNNQQDQPNFGNYIQPSHPNEGNQVNHQYHNQYKHHQSENYVQRENYHKHYHNKPKNSKPIQVYKRLLPILR